MGRLRNKVEQALGPMGRLRNIVEQALGPMGRLRNIVEQEGAKDHRRGVQAPGKEPYSIKASRGISSSTVGKTPVGLGLILCVLARECRTLPVK